MFDKEELLDAIMEKSEDINDLLEKYLPLEPDLSTAKELFDEFKEELEYLQNDVL